MVVLQQSPWYQEILQQEALRILRRQLQRRFGEMPANLQATLQGLNLEQLEELVDVAVTVNSLNEFIASVPPTSENTTEPA